MAIDEKNEMIDPVSYNEMVVTMDGDSVVKYTEDCVAETLPDGTSVLDLDFPNDRHIDQNNILL